MTIVVYHNNFSRANYFKTKNRKVPAFKKYSFLREYFKRLLQYLKKQWVIFAVKELRSFVSRYIILNRKAMDVRQPRINILSAIILTFAQMLGKWTMIVTFYILICRRKNRRSRVHQVFHAIMIDSNCTLAVMFLPTSCTRVFPDDRAIYHQSGSHVKFLCDYQVWNNWYQLAAQTFLHILFLHQCI